MVSTVDAGESGTVGFRSLSTLGKARYVAFTLVALAIVALNLALTPVEVLAAALDGWLGAASFGVHQVHDMTISAALWLALVVPLVLMLYRPTRRVNAILLPVLIAAPVAVMAYFAESELLMGFATTTVLALVAFALHPAGRSLFAFDRVESLDRRLAALAAVGALPMLVYAGLELGKQLTGPVDGHVLFVHYGAMAIAGFLIAVLGVLAVYRQRDWRFATWIAGLLAAFVGVVSVTYPALPSSLGTVGGALLFVWAVAFIASVEYVRGRGTTGSDSTGPTAETA